MFNRYPHFLLCAVLLFVLLPLLASCSSETGPKLDWKSDLELVRREFPEKEITLKQNPRLAEDFKERITAIIGKLPKYRNDDEVKLELSGALASLGQVHTFLAFTREPLLPFNLYIQEGKVYVLGTVAGYRDTLYSELTAIEGVPVEQILEKLKKDISRDNEVGLWARAPMYLRMPSVLKGLRVIEDTEKVELTFKKEDGQIISINAETLTEANHSKPEFAEYMPAQQFMQNFKHADSNYQYEYMASAKAMYIAYNSCEQDKNLSMLQFTGGLLHAARQQPIDRLIIDLRNNSGGDSSVIQPLLDTLSQNPELARHMLVLTSRTTASSAMDTAMVLRSAFQAILIGEPTNGDPNKPGNILPLKLPATGLTAYYCTTEYHNPLYLGQDAVPPDLPVPTTIEDFRAGVDPVMQAALDYKFQ
ncbi:hypothetical protein KIH86_10160 [Paenibacillus sp. HN-1]|uniref:hypothetical protein n=1 Tax=Paenibacillus TaxID=44249 RepID=UPI001CA92259|nr:MULTISPECIES: hypothetical protein [Paenibacillus]MBY9079952.1 hypothetical protein [Paenibacillus sp. CGMCC 1.18879]MBY9084594.1 hypothetical protein [Paenibacillus sinensis]